MEVEKIQKLIRSLDSGNYDYRLALAERIESLGDAAVPHLVAALKNEAWMVRQDSAEILGRIANPAALEPLRALLDDPEPGVRACAREAIGKIEEKEA